MSIKFNENKELIKLKEEILAQMKIEQKKYADNLEERMDETNRLIFESNKKFEENKDFFKNILSQKYYLDKIESLDSKSSKINDSLLAHEIRISKNIDEINSIKTKYDKVILDNLLLPGQIGPSCKYKNLSQYLKNNIYDMVRMKEDNENIKNLSKDLKVKYETEAKNVTGLIDNSVIRSNQYTDSRINDCISILEHKTKEMSEKIMDLRMKFIEKQENLEKNLNFLKQHFEEKIKKQDENIKELNSIIMSINDNLPDEENIHENIDKLKNKLKNMKNLLINFINNFQQLNNNNNNNNNQSQAKHRRNSMMLGIDLAELINDNSEEPTSKRKKNLNEQKLVDINPAKNKDRTKELLSPKHVRKGTVVSLKYKSNQKQNIKLQLINISENSSDNNDNNNDKSRHQKDKKNTKKKLDEINEKTNSNHVIIESKKDKNKNDRNYIINKVRGNKNKSSIRHKMNKNTSKSNKKDNSPSDSFSSISGSSDSNYYFKEKDKEMDDKYKSNYHGKKNNEKIVIQSKTINNPKRSLFPLGNTSLNSYNNFQNFNIDPNNLTNIKLKNTYQNFSRNLNNNNNNQSSNSNLNSQQMNFYHTQQEEKKEIIKDFFSKYDKNAIHENLNLIKNRANLDLYNYSVSPPDNRHFLDTKKDEIYDPPLSKEFLLNKKNNQNSKLGNLSREKNYHHSNKLNLGKIIEPNSKKLTMNNSIERKSYFNNNNTNYNNKFYANKKVETSSKFTNTYKNYFPENNKREKMFSLNSSKKF